jgi:acyl-CoA thioester hydrolase
MSREEGLSWMVTQNQIAYFRPVLMMERVVIETQLIRYSEKTVTVEMRMWNESLTEFKSILWSVFIFVNLKNNSAEESIHQT